MRCGGNTPSPRPSPSGRGRTASPCSVWTLTPALSLRERENSESVLSLDPHPGPLPQGEGEKQVRAQSGPSPRPSPSRRGRTASPRSICPLSHWERVRVRGLAPAPLKAYPAASSHLYCTYSLYCGPPSHSGGVSLHFADARAAPDPLADCN